MANCPKCNAHLRLIDWKQHCPHCGANIFVYDLQERLMQQADVAEVQNYHFQKKLNRLKASFIGSKLAITRIITSIIPIAALFLPLVKAKATGMFEAFNGNLSVLTIYNNVDKIDMGQFGTLLSSDGGTALVVSVALLVLSVLFTLLHFIFLTLACSPKGKPRNIIFDALILITAILSPVFFMTVPESGMLSGSIGLGSILYIVLQITNVVIDVLTLKQGIEVKHKQALVGGIPIEEYFEMLENDMPHEEIRAEQYRRLQAMQDEKEKELKEKEAHHNKEHKGVQTNG